MTCVTFFSTVAKLKELQKRDCTHLKENCQGFKLVYISFIFRMKKILKPPFDPKCPNTFDKGSTFRQAFSNVVFNTAVNRREKHREFDRCERQRAVDKVDFLNELSDLAARNSCSANQEFRPKVYAFTTKGRDFVLLKK